ncbi:MAG: hypothetical protein QOJ93_3323, partial [Actinomycetota bacterium]|nr:hypothetical protein [Actinomycetota bacterium]
ELAADRLAALAAGTWCGLNFWRRRQAHRLVSAAGWLATTEGLKVCEYKVVFYTALYSKTI